MACMKINVSVLQEVKGLTSYPGGRPVSMQNFQLIVRLVYLFLT